MKILERHTCPDATLTVVVVEGDDGEMAVGFEGSDWHTHPDLLAHWLRVPEQLAVATFVKRLLTDELPVVLSTDGGRTVAPWVSDNLQATMAYFGENACTIRWWSGVQESRDR